MASFCRPCNFPRTNAAVDEDEDGGKRAATVCDTNADLAVLPPHHHHHPHALRSLIKTFELRGKNKAELNKQLDELRRDLLAMRVKQQSGQSQQKPLEIRNVRRSIARVLTVINQQTKAAVREQYAGKKYIPTDLRAKKTRAIRRALTASEKKIKTVKAQKKATHFPQRSFAVLA
ncbi:60S ribosomal protein L35, L29 [Blastocladiella emersonii ATCC 22665]|nr:60S ribosomal protein L35, L29 [Blastocladiella emersonii ATCC 22665]